MQPIHKFLSHATIHVAMWFTRWSRFHADRSGQTTIANVRFVNDEEAKKIVDIINAITDLPVGEHVITVGRTTIH